MKRLNTFRKIITVLRKSLMLNTFKKTITVLRKSLMMRVNAFKKTNTVFRKHSKSLSQSTENH